MKATSIRLALCIFVSLIVLASPWPEIDAATTITFTAEELLGKPTNSSVTVNIVPDATIEYHYQYGTSPGVYPGQTPHATASAGRPHEVVIGGLAADTKYYYRMRYHSPGDAMDDWVERAEHTFHTQRARGSPFTFTVTSDTHGQVSSPNFTQAVQNIKNDQPDFHIDLGDTFYPDNAASQTAVDTAYLSFRNPQYQRFNAFGHSVPIFLSPGNHENEEGWNLDDTPFSIGVASIQARKAYYPTPAPGDGFYSGNTDPLEAIDEASYGDKLRENYYAWEWGDALFLVIDPFQYTPDLPYAPGAAGEGTDDPQTGDQWSWTLGQQQFNWFRQTLENSSARYKFVFSHQMVGGIPNLWISGVGPGYVRGGAQAAAYFEWGGRNADGTPGFDARRPGWGGVPIHQLMVQHGVSAYFHGHDHQYVYETRDGIVYQEVPSPSMTGLGFTGIYTEGDFTDYRTIEIVPSTWASPNSGHLRVTVTPDQATVEYVRSNVAGVAHSYVILPAPVTCAGDFDRDGDVDGTDLASLVGNASLLGLPAFAGSFGRDICQ